MLASPLFQYMPARAPLQALCTHCSLCLSSHRLPSPDCCLVARSCPTLCNPTDYSPPGSSVHGDSPSKNTGMGSHSLFQGIFPTQGLNPGLRIAGRFFTVLVTREAHSLLVKKHLSSIFKIYTESDCFHNHSFLSPRFRSPSSLAWITVKVS